LLGAISTMSKFAESPSMSMISAEVSISV
jgi:hypothetical protein